MKHLERPARALLLVATLALGGCPEPGPVDPSVNFTFQPTRSTVSLEAGGPSASIGVTATSGSLGGGCFWELQAPAGISAGGSVFGDLYDGRTCGDFSFSIRARVGMTAGTYDATLRGSQSGVVVTRTLSVTVSPNSEGIVATLEGVVTDTSGFAELDARVVLSRAGSEVDSGDTDFDGGYLLRAPEVGPHSVALSGGAAGRIAFVDTVEVDIQTGENTRDLRIQDAHALVDPSQVGNLSGDGGSELALPALGWRVWSRAGCPGCSHWVVVGIEGVPAAAFEVPVPGTFAEGGATGSAELSVTVPEAPGTYDLEAARFVAASREVAETRFTERYADPSGREREFIWLGVLRSIDPSGGTTITWTGDAGGADWFTAGNWDLGRVPEAGDRVVIPDATDDVRFGRDGTTVADVTIRSLENAGTLQVGVGRLTVTDGGTVAGALDVVALESIDAVRPTLTLGAPLSVSGDWRCDGGRLSGARIDLGTGSTATLASTLPTALSGCQLVETTVSNRGTLVTGPQNVLFTTATLRNEAGGTVEATNARFESMNCTSSPCPDQVENLGTFSVVSAAQSSFGVRLINPGTLSVASALLLGAGIDHSGALTAPSAAVTLTASSTFSGGSVWTSEWLAINGGEDYGLDGSLTADNVYVDGGASAVFGGTVDIGRLTVLDAAAEIVTGGPVELDDMDVQGTATFAVAAGTDVRVSGRLTWQGGTFTGAGTTTVVKRASTDPEARLVMSDLVSDLRLDGHHLRIYGSGSLGGDIEAGNGAVLEIRADSGLGQGFLELLGDGDFLGTALGGLSTFRNVGTVQKTGGTGEALIRACYDDEGVGVTATDPGAGSIVIEVPEGCS